MRRPGVLLALLLALAAATLAGTARAARTERVLFRACQVCRRAVAHWQRTGAWAKGQPAALKEDDLCPKVRRPSPAFYRGKRCVLYEQGACQLYVDAKPARLRGGDAGGAGRAGFIVNPFLPGFVARAHRRKLLALGDFDEPAGESRDDEWCKDTIAVIKKSPPLLLLMTQGCVVRGGKVPEYKPVCDPVAACGCLRDEDNQAICAPQTPGQSMCVNAGRPNVFSDPDKVRAKQQRRKARGDKVYADILKAGPAMQVRIS